MLSPPKKGDIVEYCKLHGEPYPIGLVVTEPEKWGEDEQVWIQVGWLTRPSHLSGETSAVITSSVQVIGQCND